MESLSQGDSGSNSSDPDDELGPAYVNESGQARILGRMTGNSDVTRSGKGCRPSARKLFSLLAYKSIRGDSCGQIFAWSAADQCRIPAADKRERRGGI